MINEANSSAGAMKTLAGNRGSDDKSAVWYSSTKIEKVITLP
jgi:hypothetical protein